MQRWQCPMHNGTLKRFVLSSIEWESNVYNFVKFIIFNCDIPTCEIAHFYCGKLYKNYKIKNLKSLKKINIFQIIDQKKNFKDAVVNRKLH